MMKDKAEYQPGVRELIKAGVSPISRRITQTGLETAQRIGGKIDPFRVPGYFREYADRLDSDIFVTDRPERIFGGRGTVYTVTSSLALKNVQNGNLLVPPMHHNEKPNDIRTHRGIGLELFTGLTGILGIDEGSKDYYVWLGAQIDGEQFVSEDTIARKGPLVDTELEAVFFDKSNSGSDPRMHPKLRDIISALRVGRSLYKENSEYANYVDELLNVIHINMGKRDGWYTEIEDVLKGESPPPREIPYDFEEGFTDIASGRQPVSEESQAVILEVDTQKLFALTPIYPFPLSGRPPSTIIPAPHMPIAAVKAIYAESEPSDIGPLSKLIRPITDLPIDTWLSGRDGQPVTHQVVREVGLNPKEPICSFRYVGNPVEIWAQHFRDGDIAPWIYDRSGLLLREPRGMLEKSLKQHVLYEARQSGLLKEVTSMIGIDEAEMGILGEAEGNVTLASVRSLRAKPTEVYVRA